MRGTKAKKIRRAFIKVDKNNKVVQDWRSFKRAYRRLKKLLRNR